MAFVKKLLSRFFGDRNNREVSSGIFWMFMVKGGALLVSVLIVPAYMDYFSDESVYGAWRTVSSVFLWMNMFDFGIGNGLRNYLVKTLASKDDEASKKYISSAYVSVGVISLAFLVVGLVIVFALNWNSIMDIPENVVSALTFKVFVAIVYSGVVFHFFFLLISSVCYALQKSFLPSLISLITQIMLLLFLFIPNAWDVSGKVVGLSIMYFVAYNLPILILTLILFGGPLKRMKPSIKWLDKTMAKNVMGLGGIFFVIQIAMLAMNSSNEVYITTFFGTEYIQSYDSYYKLFYVLMMMVTLVLQPIWSAITKAYCEKRFTWLRKIYFALYGLGFILCVITVAFALLYQPIADLWLGKGALIVNTFDVTTFTLLTAAGIICNITNSFSNGLGKLKCQLICTVAGALLKLVLVFVLVNVLENPTWSIVVLSNFLAMLPLLIVHPIYIARFIQKELTRAKNSAGAQDTSSDNLLMEDKE